MLAIRGYNEPGKHEPDFGMQQLSLDGDVPDTEL
jgi:hypothetical protein